MQTNGQDIEKQAMDLIVRAGGWRLLDTVTESLNPHKPAYMLHSEIAAIMLTLAKADTLSPAERAEAEGLADKILAIGG